MREEVWVGWASHRASFDGTRLNSTRTHLSRAAAADVSAGSFPLACGAWAPDPMDSFVEIDHWSSKPRCKRCLKVAAKEAAERKV